MRFHLITYQPSQILGTAAFRPPELHSQIRVLAITDNLCHFLRLLLSLPCGTFVDCSFQECTSVILLWCCHYFGL